MSDYITRKELADKLEIGESTLKRKEKELGLVEERDPLCKKPIRYKTETIRTKLALYGHPLPE
jgi:DNA-binding XRE family transcriptional regulator